MTLLIDKNRKYRRFRPSPSEKVQLANNGLQWVLSSNISAVGVNDNDLIVRFHNGSLYKYPNQAELFKPMMASNSKGHFLWAKLRKPRVAYQKLGALPLSGDVETSDDDILKLIDNEGLAFVSRLKEMGMFIPTTSNGLDLISLKGLLQ